MANLILIRDLCERKKMTIRELAQKIGRNESSIQSAIRRGTTNSTTIELIAKELGVSAGIFFDGFDGGRSNCRTAPRNRSPEGTPERKRTYHRDTNERPQR